MIERRHDLRLEAESAIKNERNPSVRRNIEWLLECYNKKKTAAAYDELYNAVQGAKL